MKIAGLNKMHTHKVVISHRMCNGLFYLFRSLLATSSTLSLLHNDLETPNDTLLVSLDMSYCCVLLL